MKNEEIISEILNIVQDHKVLPKEDFGWNVMNVVYVGDKLEGTSKTDLKNNPRFSICGKENIERYNHLFSELLKSITKGKEMSLGTFKDLTQNLIFENRFNEKNIKQAIDSIDSHKSVEFFKVYGIKMDTDIIQKGKFSFINKKHIFNYIDEKMPKLNKGDYRNQFVLNVLDGSVKETNEFIFVAVDSVSYDDTFALEKASQDVRLMTDALMFMFGLPSGCGITFSAIPVKRTNSFQLNIDYNYLNASSEMFYGAPTLKIDDYFGKIEWHDKILNIVSSNRHNDLEQRIVKAIRWVSKAFGEEDENIKRVEIAFAFESLLQLKTNEAIKESIMALLSEQYAFINGKDLEDRKNRENEFKDFYRERSGIAHGGESHFKTNVNLYFSMIIATIANILTRDCFKQCKSGNELYGIIKNMKYKVVE